MRGTIPPLPNTPSWRGAQLKHRDYLLCHHEPLYHILVNPCYIYRCFKEYGWTCKQSNGRVTSRFAYMWANRIVYFLFFLIWNFIILLLKGTYRTQKSRLLWRCGITLI